MTTTISAIIPTYNVGRYIGETISSALAQTRLPDEILIVDDCSTDDTLKIAKSLAAASGGRLRVLSRPSNGGSAVARNQGIVAATGDYIALLDGDDIWLPTHLEVVAGLLDRHADAVLAYSGTEAFGDDHFIWPMRIPPDVSTNCFWECLPQTIIPQMNVVARRKTVLEVGGYQPQLRQTQDYDLFLRLAFEHKFVCSHQITTRYRRHNGSITRRQPNASGYGMYMSRDLFLQQNRDRLSSQMLHRLEQTYHDLWINRLKAHASRCEYAMVDFHLSQHGLIPKSTSDYRRWRWWRRWQMLRCTWQWGRENFHKLIGTRFRAKGAMDNLARVRNAN